MVASCPDEAQMDGPVVATLLGEGAGMRVARRRIGKAERAVSAALGHGVGQEEVVKASEFDQRERDWGLRYLRSRDLADLVWGRYFSK